MTQTISDPRSHSRLCRLMIAVAFIVAAGMVRAAPPSAILLGPNLLVNGGFELGQHPGAIRQSATYGAWTANDPSATALLGLPYSGGVPPLAGVNAMHIGYNRQAGSVRQSFATSVGERYQVTLSAIGWEGAPGSGSIRVRNSAGATELASTFSSPNEYMWQQSQFAFTASGTLATLELQNTPPAATSIDDVSVHLVTAVPVSQYFPVQLVELFTVKGDRTGITSVAFSPDGGPALASGQNSVLVNVWVGILLERL